MLEFDAEQQKQIDYMKAAVEPDHEDGEDNKEEKATAEDQVNLDLFGAPIESDNKPSSKPKIKPTKPSNPEKKYGQDYICLVYDKRIPVPDDNLSLEQIRHYLEMEYPQFGKERTEMMVDEEAHYIIPVVTKAPKKG